jgi:hypothetical protein
MPKNKIFGFGTRGDIPADAEEKRIIPFVLSTYNKDRHGTVLNQDNWMLDNYRKNPVVAYQHTLSGGMCTDPNPDYVIGKSVSLDLEGTGLDRKLIAAAEFEPADVNPLAEKVFRKLLFGSLSRSSVGFLQIGEGHYGEGDEARDQANETYYFAGQELLEWSVVNLPSNPHAGKRDMTMRRMREEGYIAFMYAFRELGGKFRLSEIDSMTVRDILTLLDGKDLEIKEKDPEKVAAMLRDEKAKADEADRITRQQSLHKLENSSLKG